MVTLNENGMLDWNHNENGLEKLRLIEQLKPIQLQSPRNGSETWAIAFAPDNSCFAWSCGNRTVVVLPWNASKNRPIDSFTDPANTLITPGRPLVIQCDDFVWSLTFGSSNSHNDVEKCTNSASCIKSRRKSSCTLHDFNSSVNKLILAIGLNNGRIRIYSVFTGKFLTELVDHKDVIRDIKFAPDGSLILLSASRDSTLKLWDLNDDGNMFRTLKAHQVNEWVMCCAWSPNSKFAASGGSQKSLIVYETEQWSVFRILRAHHHCIVSCQFSPDNALLASASYDTTVILWDYINEQQLAILWHKLPPPRLIYASGDNDCYVRYLSFSPDGEHLATVCDDGNLRIWSILHPDRPVGVTEVSNAVCTTYSADGFCLSVGTREGNLHLFAAPMRVKSLMENCRVRIRKCLISSEHVCQLPVSQNLKKYLKYQV